MDSSLPKGVRTSPLPLRGTVTADEGVKKMGGGFLPRRGNAKERKKQATRCIGNLFYSSYFFLALLFCASKYPFVFDNAPLTPMHLYSVPLLSLAILRFSPKAITSCTCTPLPLLSFTFLASKMHHLNKFGGAYSLPLLSTVTDTPSPKAKGYGVRGDRPWRKQG